MEPVIEAFSAGRRLAVHPSQADELVRRFAARPVSDRHTWAESARVAVTSEPLTPANALHFDSRKLVVTEPVGGLVLLESTGDAIFRPELCAELSATGPVYDLGADIWVPYMEFRAYADGALRRKVEYGLDPDAEDVAAEEIGDPVPAERPPLRLPEPEHGYDDFYYPLAVLEGLGVTMPMLDQCLGRPCRILDLGADAADAPVGAA